MPKDRPRIEPAAPLAAAVPLAADPGGLGPATAPRPRPQRTRVLPVGVVSGVPLLVVIGLSLQVFGPDAYKPTTIFNVISGHQEAENLRQELNERDAALAARTRDSAQLQQEVAALQATTGQVTAAYKTLYQRASALAERLNSLQQQDQQLRQQLGQAAAGPRAGQAPPRQGLQGVAGALPPAAAKDAGNLGQWQNGLPDSTELDRILADRHAPEPAPSAYGPAQKDLK